MKAELVKALENVRSLEKAGREATNYIARDKNYLDAAAIRYKLQKDEGVYHIFELYEQQMRNGLERLTTSFIPGVFGNAYNFVKKLAECEVEEFALLHYFEGSLDDVKYLVSEGCKAIGTTIIELNGHEYEATILAVC